MLIVYLGNNTVIWSVSFGIGAVPHTISVVAYYSWETIHEYSIVMDSSPENSFSVAIASVGRSHYNLLWDLIKTPYNTSTL